MIIGFCSFYIHEASIDDSKEGYIESQLSININSFTKETLESLKAGKLVDNIPLFGIFGDGTGNYPTYIYGDYYKRVLVLFSSFDKNATIENVKEQLDPYITEISKEEYEALIEIPNVIIGKE